ncbi:MAG: translation initiation factor 2, partial [Lachnospiraceae bacterium]|nr:translation initiation factor 2 [Lachnospiraceae bacterium]
AGGGKVVSAGGKSNIFAELMKRQDQEILVIADGAAFGPEMDRVMKLIRQKNRILLYLPESFEWLILSSGVVTEKNLNRLLENPEEFIESSQYFSWERFFTDVLVSATKGTILQYSKRKLNEVYLHKEISKKIAEQMEGILFT